MARQMPPQWQCMPVLATPCRKRLPPTAEDGLLHGFMGGVRMVPRIILFQGICAFSTYIGLLCTAFLIDAVQVLFTTIIPSALLIFHYLFSALILLFCLHWMREIVTQQFWTHEPLGDTSMAHQMPPQWQPTPLLATPSCKRLTPTAEDGLLHSFMGGVRMVLSIILFLGICAFSAYVGLLCMTLLISAVLVLFTTLLPSVLPILSFLLSALVLFLCLQWMREILTQQFQTHKRLV